MCVCVYFRAGNTGCTCLMANWPSQSSWAGTYAPDFMAAQSDSAVAALASCFIHIEPYYVHPLVATVIRGILGFCERDNDVQ